MFYGQVKICLGPSDGEVVGGRNKRALRKGNKIVSWVKSSGPDNEGAYPGGLTTVRLWMATMMTVLLWSKGEFRRLIDWQKASCFLWTRAVRGGDKNTIARYNSKLILERMRRTGGWENVIALGWAEVTVTTRDLSFTQLPSSGYSELPRNLR